MFSTPFLEYCRIKIDYIYIYTANCGAGAACCGNAAACTRRRGQMAAGV